MFLVCSGHSCSETSSMVITTRRATLPRSTKPGTVNRFGVVVMWSRRPPSAGPTGIARAAARLAHRASQDITDAEFAADPLHVDGLALVGEARIAGDHKQPADARERGDDFLDHAVGEIFLPGITAQIGEGQHRDRGLVRER